MKILIPKFKFIIIFGASLALLIFFHYLGALKPLENLFFKILEPLQSQTTIVGNRIQDYFYRFSSVQELQEENQELKDRVNNLIVENIRLNSILEENKILEEQLEFVKENNFDYLPTRVIGKNFDNSLRVLILNKGQNNGVKIGFPVIVGRGILVGQIVEVQNNISKALLLTDSHSVVGAKIQNKTQTSGIVVGEHGLTMKMELIPQNEEVRKNDLVITSGLEEYLPENLVIGEVEKVTIKTGELFQVAIIQPTVSLDHLEILTILKF